MLQHRWRHRRVVVKVLRILAVVNVLMRLLRVLRPVRVGIDRGIGRNSRDSGDSGDSGDAVVLKQLREVCGRYANPCGLCLQPTADAAIDAARWRGAAPVILGRGGRRHLAPLTLGGQVAPSWTGSVTPGRLTTLLGGDARCGAHWLAAWEAVGIRRKPRAVSQPHARRLAISKPHAIANRREAAREREGERVGG